MNENATYVEHWRRLDQLFADAIELNPGERHSFLEVATAGNTALRRAVERLLEADEEAKSFLKEPIDAPDAFNTMAASAPDTGCWIGPYKLLHTLSQGGMGIVYLASRADDEYDRLVAVKLIRHGFESAEIRRRFHAERQALALLEHPNIARMYDGGTLDDTRPYLVMEYIDGMPIDRYCDHHRLSVKDRVELFCQVCSAVQHAHHRLLIHRDIKPSNVLVTADGVPKLLDFGLSKTLDPAAAPELDETRAGLRMMTPGYASPEQVRGEPVTTATDVYALGVLLYELLAGQRPYRLDSERPGEIERAICDQIPERPSVVAGPRSASGKTPTAIARARRATPRQLRRQLKGDLDNIVLTALRKEPDRRYALVEQLANDLRRHLEQRPVLARPDTLLYRSGKFLRRHRLGVAAVMLIFALTIASVVTVAQQAQRANEERDRSDQVAQFLLDIFSVSAPDAAVGSTITARQILDAGAKRIGAELGDRPRLQAMMLDTMGVAYRQLGLRIEARSLLEQGLEIRRDLFGEEHPEVAQSLYNLAVANTEDGHQDLAHSQYQEILRVRRRLLGKESPEVGETLDAMAMNLWWDGQFAEAKSLFEEALAIRRKAFGHQHRAVADTLSDLGALLRQIGELETAESLTHQALEIRRAILGDVHPEVASSYNDLAHIYFERGDAADAIPLYEEVLRVRQEFLGETHLNVVVSMNDLARCYEELGRYEEAEETFRQLLTIREEIHLGIHPGLATSLNNLANVLHLQGKFEDAEKLLHDSLAMRLELFGDDSPWVAQSRNSLGRLLHDQGNLDAAQALIDQAMEGIAQLPERHPARAYVMIQKARLQIDQGHAESAEALLHDSLELLNQVYPEDHWRIGWAESLLGGSLVAQGRLQEAEPLLKRGFPLLQAKRSDRDPRTRRALERLIELYRSSNQPERVEEYSELLRAAFLGTPSESAIDSVLTRS